MSKPSIFSQNYSDSMKKRRRKIIVSVIVILVIVCGGAFYISKNTSMKDVRENVKKIASSLKDEKSNDDVPKEKKEEGADNTAQPQKDDEVVSEEKGTNKTDANETEKNEAAVNDKIGKEIPEEKNEEDKKEYIGLGKETMVTINYKIKDGKNEIVSLDGNEKITWDILNNMVVVNIKESFNTYLIHEDFKVENITMKEYISTKKKAYAKDYVSERYKGYVWAIDPKFIDVNTIVYKSNLPFINDKKLQFVWKYNIKEGTHQKIFHQMPNSDSIVLGGKDVIFGKIESNKINITVDGYNFLVDSTGNVTIK